MAYYIFRVCLFVEMCMCLTSFINSFFFFFNYEFPSHGCWYGYTLHNDIFMYKVKTGATSVIVDKFTDPRNGTPALLIQGILDSSHQYNQQRCC